MGRRIEIAVSWILFLLIGPAIVAMPALSHPRDAESPSWPEVDFGKALADTNDIVDIVADTMMTLQLNGHPLKVPYFANRLLDANYTDVTRAILVICGTLRNADDYYRSVMEAASIAGGADAHTLVIAPQFLTEPDIERHHLASDVLYWAYMGWRQGDQSLDSNQNPRPARISSFAVADTILLRLARRNPNLTQIVVAGHSAGGQFSNLYCAGNRIEQVLVTTYQVPVRYVVSNPSCYIYFTNERWVVGTSYAFAVPATGQISQCPGYNNYKYGLDNPNEYMSVGSATLIQQYGSRHAVYLLGGADTNPHDYYLDTSCQAEFEGAYRLERGTVYWNFLQYFYGTGIRDVQQFAVVPGIGHDHEGMFTSACGVFYLFDYGECADAPPSGAKWLDVTTPLLESSLTHSVAWGDYDSDGRPDLFLAASFGQNQLIHNQGSGDFTDATSYPLDLQGHGMSAAWGDYDNDGLPDLYVVNWREANHLYHNDGAGFSDVTQIPLVIGDCCDAAWADYDNDGDLDLYITRTSNQSNVLLRNDGTAGFADASAPPINFSANSKHPAWGDYDNDGDLDVYVSVDGANRLLRNNGNGTFSDVTSGPLGDTRNSSCAAWGDMDNDGDLDLYIVERNQPNRLLRNDGGGSFVDIAVGALADPYNGRSTTWGDYDNDGLLDLYVVNTNARNRLLHNEGDGVFSDSTVTPLDDNSPNYSAAWADYDLDGDLDIYMAANQAPNHMIKNALAAAGNHWLQLNLVGSETNRSAIGTRVRVVAGGFAQIRQVGGDAGNQAQNTLTVEFGLGSALLVDTLQIRWPSGIVQVGHHIDVNQRFTVIESDLPQDAPWWDGPVRRTTIVACPNPFGSQTTIRWSHGDIGVADPSSRETTIEIYDPMGRRVRAITGLDGLRSVSHEVVWDGRDDLGRRVAPGVYLCRVGTAANGKAVRLVKVR
jgi:hypothetical protein